MKTHWFTARAFLLMLIVLTSSGQLSAQDMESVAATVGETKIMVSRIQRHLDRTLGDRKVSDRQLAVLRRETLQHFVNRELVNHFLILRDYTVGPSQIQLKIEILTANLERVGQTLNDFLAKQNQTLESLENEIAWQIRWEKYLEKTLTDEVLQSYFDRHRRKFDGTEIRVAQILFRTLESEKSVEAALMLAADKKLEIENGNVTWNQAVEQNSVAASRENDGVVGWIRYNEPMPREFSKRAFMLEPGGLSDPFVSGFGVHLLKCLEVKPGKSEFGDVRREVEVAATKELFERIAGRHRSEVTVDYSEGWELNE